MHDMTGVQFTVRLTKAGISVYIAPKVGKRKEEKKEKDVVGQAHPDASTGRIQKKNGFVSRTVN